MLNGRPHRSLTGPQRKRGRGFTLLEMCMAGAALALLTAIAVPGYSHILERQKVEQCKVDLRMIALQIQKYRIARGEAPMSLNDLGITVPKDPWGQDYRFLNFDAKLPGIKGKIRKDHNLHPLNSEFDLYSVGKDGRSMSPLTAKPSRDDVIWARDGGFVGLASDY